MSFKDPTWSVTHDKKSGSIYEGNAHILKLIIEAVILCLE